MVLVVVLPALGFCGQPERVQRNSESRRRNSRLVCRDSDEFCADLLVTKAIFGGEHDLRLNIYYKILGGFDAKSFDYLWR